MMAWLAPYKHVVDSINAHTVAYAPNAMHGGGLGEYANWTADMAFHSVQQQLDSIHQADPQSTLPANVDLAIMNGGGIRLNLPQGNVAGGEQKRFRPHGAEILRQTGRLGLVAGQHQRQFRQTRKRLKSAFHRGFRAVVSAEAV